MLRDEGGEYLKFYDYIPVMNDVLYYIMHNVTDAKYNQIVNFGKSESKGIKNSEKKLQALIDHNIIKHIDKDLYQLNPYIIGNGDWEDVFWARRLYDAEEFDKRYKVSEYSTKEER